MKIAFLFLMRNDHYSLICWDLFFKNIDRKLYSIYCHPKTKLNQELFKNNIVSNVIPTKWADISLVRATLILLANAYKDKNNTHFILLSDSCVPIINFSHLYKILLKTNKSCIHFKHLSNKLNRYHLLSPLIKKNLTFNQFYCQHQWMMLVRDDVNFFIKQDLTYHFSKIPVSDEHYFISLLILSKKKKNNIINKKITYCNWEDNTSMHPKVYDKLLAQQIIQLQKEGYLFIRKIIKDYKPNQFHYKILLS